MKVKGYILGAVSAISYGMIPLFAIPLKRMGLSFDTVLFYRFLFSALMIGGWLLYKRVDLRVTRKEFGVLALLGLMFGSSSFFLFLGYDYMPAGVASTILFLYPVLVALIMGVGFREKMSWQVWLAIILAFAGVVALEGGGDSGHVAPIGIFIVFLSSLAYAIYMVIINQSKTVKVIDGTKITFYAMAVSSVLYLVKALVSGTFQAIPSVEVGANLALFALVPTVISLLTMVPAIRLIGATPTAIMGSMEPLVAVAISVAVFDEAFTDSLALGILLIVVAVLLTVLSGVKKGKKLPEHADSTQ